MGLDNIDEKMTTMEPMLLDNSSNENHFKSQIFGQYHKFLTSLFIFPQNSQKANTARSKIYNYFGIFVFILGLLPLILRFLFFAGALHHTTLFSLNWTYNLMFLFQQLHSIFSLITLFILFKTNFYHDFIKKFLRAIKNKIPTGNPYIKSHIILGIFFCFYMLTNIFYCYENITDYEHFVVKKQNSSALFRESMFGAFSFFIFDSSIIVWTSFVSSLALIAYNLVSTSLTTEYQRFNSELKEASKAGQLGHVDLLNNYGSRQLEFMELAQYSFSKFGLLVTFTLITGILTHGLAGFIMRSFVNDLPVLCKIVTILYMILGILMLLANVKRASDFAHQIEESKNIILFEKSIHTTLNDKLILIANNIVFRITNCHYLPSAFKSFKINEKFFQRVFLIFPFLIEFLNAYKVQIN